MEIKSIDYMDFDTLYDTYTEQVYQTALHYSGNHHVAEEITQAVFMEILDYEEYIRQENVEAWFYAVARNKTLKYLKKHRKEILVESFVEEKDNIVHIEGFDTIVDKGTMEEQYIEKISREKRALFLEKVYDELYEKNERWYLAIMGVYILEVPQNVMAEKMGISLHSLEMILSRAKNWIRKQYQKEFDRLEKQ